MKIERIILTAPAAICLILLAGCASTQEARLYVLHAPDMVSNSMATDEALLNTQIILGRVRLPKHLDRPAILTQVSDSELAYSEFHRWAAPLDRDLTRVIALNLSRLTGSQHVVGYRSATKADDNYRVDLDILSMTGVLGKEAILTARWHVSGGKTKAPPTGSSGSYRATLQSDSYAAYVAAQSQLILDLSRDMEKSLRVLSSAPSSGEVREHKHK